MLVYLTRPLKGYANREGEVINLPDTLAAQTIRAGGGLPYHEEIEEDQAAEAPQKQDPNP